MTGFVQADADRAEIAALKGRLAALERAFARVVSAMPSAERLREIADTLDFLDKLAVWVANREGLEFGQSDTKQQRELRALADALDAGSGDAHDA